jgi:hypothetical protein
VLPFRLCLFKLKNWKVAYIAVFPVYMSFPHNAAYRCVRNSGSAFFYYYSEEKLFYYSLFYQLIACMMPLKMFSVLFFPPCQARLFSSCLRFYLAGCQIFRIHWNVKSILLLLRLCLVHAEVWKFGWNWYNVIEKLCVYERFDVMESWKFGKKLWN